MWRREQFVVITVLLAVATCNYFDRHLLNIIQEPVKQDLKLSDWQLGLLGGPTFAFFYALSGLPSARFAERRDRSAVLSIILGVWSTMTALCGVAQNFVMLALFRAGVGLGEGGCLPLCQALTSEHFKARQRGMAIAILACASPIGGIVSSLAGAAIAQEWGWRAAFLALGVPGLLLAVIVRFTVRDPAAAEAKARAVKEPNTFRRDFAWLVKSRTFMLLLGANGAMGLANSAMGMFTASYFLRTYELTLQQVAFIFAGAVSVAGLVGTLSSGLLADRFAGTRGRSYVLIPSVGAALAGVCFMLAFTRDSWPVAVALLVVANFGTDCKTPNMAAVQNISPPHMRATSSAMLYMAITVFGTGLGPPFAGGISDMLASNAFTLGNFQQLCPGGVAIAGASEAAVAACREASAAGVRGGLIAGASLFFVASIFFYLSSRTIYLTIGGEEENKAA